MVEVLEVTITVVMEEASEEVVAAEVLLVERRNHKGSQKMVAFMNATGIFQGAGHVPPKKVEPVVLVSEKTGAEDRARKMKLS